MSDTLSVIYLHILEVELLLQGRGEIYWLQVRETYTKRCFMKYNIAAAH